MWCEPWKQQRQPLAPAVLIHRQAIDRAVEPGGRPLDQSSAPKLAPEPKDGFLQRIGRLVIAKPKVSREVVQRRSMSVVEVGHHRRIGADGARLRPAGQDWLQARHIKQTRATRQSA